MKLSDFMTEDQMRSLISGAILNAISPEQREKMLTEAVSQLLVPKDNGYYGKRSTPLQDAFNEGAVWVARKVVQDMMESDPKWRERIRGLLNEAAERAFVTNREKTVDRMAEAISRAMERE